MKDKPFILLVVAFLLFSISCGKEDNPGNSECVNFSEALIQLNPDPIKKVMDKLTVDLEPYVSENDHWGHYENINLLIERVNTLCENLSASLGCYCCIFTLPPISEIIIATDSSGIEIRRVIDILTPDDNNLQYVGVHDYN